MYVLSHGFLMSSYKAFFNLHTWVCISCVLTSNGYKCLFIVYAFFLWESSCYESFLVSHGLLFSSRYHILDTVLHDWLVLLDHSFLPFLLVYFFIAGRPCIKCRTTVSCNCIVSETSWSFVILFFILDYFLNCRHLFFGTSLILVFL